MPNGGFNEVIPKLIFPYLISVQDPVKSFETFPPLAREYAAQTSSLQYIESGVCDFWRTLRSYVMWGTYLVKPLAFITASSLISLVSLGRYTATHVSIGYFHAVRSLTPIPFDGSPCPAKYTVSISFPFPFLSLPI